MKSDNFYESQRQYLLQTGPGEVCEAISQIRTRQSSLPVYIHFPFSWNPMAVTFLETPSKFMMGLLEFDRMSYNLEGFYILIYRLTQSEEHETL
jgi:hypothetical protein